MIRRICDKCKKAIKGIGGIVEFRRADGSQKICKDTCEKCYLEIFGLYEDKKGK